MVHGESCVGETDVSISAATAVFQADWSSGAGEEVGFPQRWEDHLLKM